VKIELNLARPRSRFDRVSAVGAPVLIIASLALLPRILYPAWVGFVEYRKVHRSVLTYQAEIADLQRQEAQVWQVLRRPPTLKLYHQITFLNSLIDQKRLSLSDLALRVTKLLPAQTRLDSLTLSDAEETPVVRTPVVLMPVVQFSVVGEQDGVYGFLSNLEQAPDFGAPTNLSETIEKEGTEQGLVHLECRAEYLGVKVRADDVKLR
jgi:hypothetical protein